MKKHEYIIVFGSMLLVFLGAMSINWFTIPRLATIDLQRLISIKAQKLAERYPNGKVPSEKLNNIAESLRQQIVVFSKSKNRVFLNKKIVFCSDLPDETEDIVKLMLDEEP